MELQWCALHENIFPRFDWKYLPVAQISELRYEAMHRSGREQSGFVHNSLLVIVLHEELLLVILGYFSMNG